MIIRPHEIRLSRTEIVSFYNTFNQISNSLDYSTTQDQDYSSLYDYITSLYDYVTSLYDYITKNQLKITPLSRDFFSLALLSVVGFLAIFHYLK